MSERESAIVEIEERVKMAMPSLQFYKRCPTIKPPQGKYPAVFILEGNDPVTHHSNSNWHGYPVKRELELTIEIWCVDGEDLKGMIEAVKTGIFKEKLATKVSLNEKKTFGPFNSGQPGIAAMQLILALAYTDKGVTTAQ